MSGSVALLPRCRNIAEVLSDIMDWIFDKNLQASSAMQSSNTQYRLTIRDVTVDTAPGSAKLMVQYQGQANSASITQPVQGFEVVDLIKTCEAVANRIFQDEFHLNDAVEMTFSLNDGRGLSLWHTKPTLYMQCPLTMTMKWSCIHLSKTYKTMTTLGLVELPSTLGLDGNQIDLNRTARVIMDSMANGVEFMGNLMRMRNGVDHEAAKRGESVFPSLAAG